MEPPSYETLSTESLEEGTVLRVLLDKPKGNILDSRMMGEISDVLARHRTAEPLRLIVIRGAGGHFSFGASVEEHRKDRAPEMLAAFHRLVRQLAAFPVPVAALVEGQCLGGGFELVLTCHLLFATPDARFGCPEIKLGVFPPVLAAVGADRLGAFPAERMLLTGDTVGTPEAERLGWLTRQVDPDDPEGDLLSWYRGSLSKLSPFALRQAALAIRRGAGWIDALDTALARTEDQYVDEVLSSHDGNEGIEAFLERRKPEWRGR